MADEFAGKTATIRVAKNIQVRARTEASIRDMSLQEFTEDALEAEMDKTESQRAQPKPRRKKP